MAFLLRGKERDSVGMGVGESLSTLPTRGSYWVMWDEG